MIIRDGKYFETGELEEVVNRLRGYEMDMKRIGIDNDQVQDPSMYGAKVSSSSTSGSAAYYTGSTGVMNSDGEICFGDGGATPTKSQSSSSSSTGSPPNVNYSSMPMSAKLAEQFSLYASFIAHMRTTLKGRS